MTSYKTTTVLVGCALILSFATAAVASSTPDPDAEASRNPAQDEIRRRVTAMTTPELLGQKLLVGLPWPPPTPRDLPSLTTFLQEYKSEISSSPTKCSEIGYHSPPADKIEKDRP